MREQHNVPVPGRKNTHSVIAPPPLYRPLLTRSHSHSLSLSDSLTGLLFLFISSVSVSAQ